MKNIRLSLFIALLIFTAVGCFHGEKIRRVHPGMSMDKVQSIMGHPEGYRKVGDYEVYTYYNKLISGWAWDRADNHYIARAVKLWSMGQEKYGKTKTPVLYL